MTTFMSTPKCWLYFSYKHMTNYLVIIRIVYDRQVKFKLCYSIDDMDLTTCYVAIKCLTRQTSQMTIQENTRVSLLGIRR